jgi:hypothetical protein
MKNDAIMNTYIGNLEPGNERPKRTIAYPKQWLSFDLYGIRMLWVSVLKMKSFVVLVLITRTILTLTFVYFRQLM